MANVRLVRVCRWVHDRSLGGLVCRGGSAFTLVVRELLLEIVVGGQGI